MSNPPEPDRAPQIPVLPPPNVLPPVNAAAPPPPQGVVPTVVAVPVHQLGQDG